MLVRDEIVQEVHWRALEEQIRWHGLVEETIIFVPQTASSYQQRYADRNRQVDGESVGEALDHHFARELAEDVAQVRTHHVDEEHVLGHEVPGLDRYVFAGWYYVRNVRQRSTTENWVDLRKLKALETTSKRIKSQ